MTRCKCHPAAYYGGCVRCPQCRHWSFDRSAAACERRRCGYVLPYNPERVQDDYDDAEARRWAK